MPPSARMEEMRLEYHACTVFLLLQRAYLALTLYSCGFLALQYTFPWYSHALSKEPFDPPNKLDASSFPTHSPTCRSTHRI
jgi:hypothetical protein